MYPSRCIGCMRIEDFPDKCNVELILEPLTPYVVFYKQHHTQHISLDICGLGLDRACFCRPEPRLFIYRAERASGHQIFASSLIRASKSKFWDEKKETYVWAVTCGLTSYARNSQKKQYLIFGEMRNVFQFCLSISCLVTIWLLFGEKAN